MSESLIPFYYEATLAFCNPEWNESKQGIVMAENEDDAWSKVVSEYEKVGGEPAVFATIFPTMRAENNNDKACEQRSDESKGKEKTMGPDIFNDITTEETDNG